MVDPVTAADMGSCPRAFKGKPGHFAWTSDFDVSTPCDLCGHVHWRNEKRGTAGTEEIKVIGGSTRGHLDGGWVEEMAQRMEADENG